jgi:hypothetical protein
MSKLALNSFVASLLVSMTLLPALAAGPNYPTVAYNATYARLNSAGTSSYRICTDGEGHVRIETTPPQAGLTISSESPARTIQIFDYPHHQSYTLLEKQKLAIEQPLRTDASAAPLDDTRIKEMNGKSLGAAVKFGQPCHGWQYEVNGVMTESWTADKLNCPIHTVTTSTSGDEVMHLQKYVLMTPDPSEFEVPHDYKITKSTLSPGMPKNQ